jgi:hypothetical protein
VGSIGSYSGGRLGIGSDGVSGILFGGTNVFPATSGSTLVDNTYDFGSIDYRWKDLYLSGGVYLGGTVAANLLEDYEEGTWTPTLGGTWTVNPTTLSGTYTKVGRLVTITLVFSGGTKASTTAGYFTGLPFAQSSSGTGAVTDSGVNDKGNALIQNVDRVWLTATTFNSSTYVLATYTTA